MSLVIVLITMLLQVYTVISISRHYGRNYRPQARKFIIAILIAAVSRQFFALISLTIDASFAGTSLTGELAVLVMTVAGMISVLSSPPEPVGDCAPDTLRNLFDCLPLAVIVCDDNGCPVYANEECAHITGKEANGTLLGADVIRKLVPTDGINADSEAGKDTGNKACRGVETMFESLKGGTRNIFWPHRARAIPLPGWGMLTIGTDITGHRHMKHDLMEYHNDLEEPVHERSKERVEVNRTLESQIIEKEIMERRLARLNESFLSFGDDPEENISRLVTALGDMLNAYSVCYSRIVGGVPVPMIRWGGQPGDDTVSMPDIAFCRDVINRRENNVRILRDLRQSTDVSGNPAIRSKQLSTYLGSPVTLRGESVGVLCVLLWNDVFPQRNDEWLLSVLASAIAVEEGRHESLSALRDSEERLKKSLLEKDMLLREVHHRVKNNLQVISSLFDLYSMETSEAASVRFFEKVRSKIHSMALIHNQLYRSDDIENIDIVLYARDLFRYLLNVYSDRAVTVTAHITGENILLPLSKAIPLGIVLNELLSNALEHGFSRGGSGILRVMCETTGTVPDILSVIIHDSGQGLPHCFVLNNQDSLGLTLVRTLVERQLGGTIAHRNNNGAVFDITIPLA